MTVRSELSYEEYRAWCASRVPPLVDEGTPFSLRLTVAAVPEDDACPVTVRSVESKAVITPRSKGSR